MKARHTDFLRGIPAAARSASIFFFCGPDEAGASAAAQKVIAALDDPGERVEISGGDLKRDPAMLGDEARSSSLFGEKRHIWVRASGDEAHDALKVLLETSDTGGGAASVIVVVALGATDKSRTAKLLEKREDALVTMFYQPDIGAVTNAVRAMADGVGLRLGGDLAQTIAAASGLDVRLAASEIEKLALYCDAQIGAPKSVSLADYEAIGARREEDGFQPLVNAVMGGQLGMLGPELARMAEIGLNPVGLLLAIERRAAQLGAIKARLGPRASLDGLGRGEKAQLGIFWKEERELAQQLARWSSTKLDRLFPRLIGLHQALLSDSQNAQLRLAHDLAEIARFAARR